MLKIEALNGLIALVIGPIYKEDIECQYQKITVVLKRYWYKTQKRFKLEENSTLDPMEQRF